jgi:hypothetical protein
VRRGELLVRPEALVEMQHYAKSGAHLEIGERARFGAKRWFKRDRATLTWWCLQDAKRYRDDDGSCRDRLSTRDVDDHSPRFPANACDNGRETDARRQRCCQPGDDAIVAINDVRKSPLADVLAGAAAFGEGLGANQVCVGGVKPFDIFAGQRAVH